jgi:hypothetical protein
VKLIPILKHTFAGRISKSLSKLVKPKAFDRCKPFTIKKSKLTNRSTKRAIKDTRAGLSGSIKKQRPTAVIVQAMFGKDHARRYLRPSRSILLKANQTNTKFARETK